MKTEFTATIKKDGDWWIGWIEEIPGANAQEKTKKELIASLKEVAKDIIELRQQSITKHIPKDFERITLAL